MKLITNNIKYLASTTVAEKQLTDALETIKIFKKQMGCTNEHEILDNLSECEKQLSAWIQYLQILRN